MSVVRAIYESFQRGTLDEWDDLVSENVIITSPVSYGEIQGLEALKGWAKEFLKSLSPRIDLIDEYEGDGRGFITVCLNWKHTAPFFEINPTGRAGTSIETFLFTIENGKVTRWTLAAQTLDLAIYLWQKGMPAEHNAQPKAIVEGIDR